MLGFPDVNTAHKLISFNYSLATKGQTTELYSGHKQPTTHQVVYFDVLKRGHHSVVLEAWTVANEDGLERVDRQHLFGGKVKCNYSQQYKHIKGLSRIIH